MTLLVIFSVVLSAWLAWRLGPASPASVLSILVSASAVALYCLLTINPYYVAVATTVPLPLQWIGDDPVWAFSVCLAIQAAVSIGGLVSKRAAGRGAVRQTQVTSINLSKSAILAFATASSLLCFVHFMMIDKQMLWRTSQYLLIGDPAYNGLGEGIGRIIQFAVLPLAAMSTSIIGVAIAARNYPGAAIATVPALYGLVISFAANSRWAPLTLAGLLAGFALSKMKRKTKVFVVAVGVVIIFISYIMVIQGRVQPEQGVSAILGNFASIDADRSIRAIQTMSINLFDLAPGIAVSRNIVPDYTTTYKLLVFSPFPSFIDGYEAVRQVNQFRYNSFTPISGPSEALTFGYGYFLFYLLGLAVFSGMLDYAYRRIVSVPRPIWIFVVLYVFSQISAYPIRQSFRWMMLAILLVAFAVWRERHTGRQSSFKASRRPIPSS